MAFDWNSFAGGMAKTFNPQIVGGATNQYLATRQEDQALQNAQAQRDEAIKTLDDSRAATQQAGKGVQVQAIPAAGDDSGVDAVSGASPSVQPISDQEYAARRRAIDTDYRNAAAQARIDYYKYRGMDKERMAAEDKLANDKWHQGFVDQYYKILNGDADATGKLVGYMNASSYDGTKIQQNQDGTLSLLGSDGQVLQANFKPTRAQIDSAFTNYYNTAKFFHDGDMEGYLSRSASTQKMALDDRAANREDAKAAETVRHNRASEDLTASGQDVMKRGQTLTHVAAMAKLAADNDYNDRKLAIEQEKADAARMPKPVKYSPQKMDDGSLIMAGDDGSYGARIDTRGRYLPKGVNEEGLDKLIATAESKGVQLSVTPSGAGVYQVPELPEYGFRKLEDALAAKKQKAQEDKKAAKASKTASKAPTAIKTPEQMRSKGEKDAVGKWKEGAWARFKDQSKNPRGGD